MRKTIGILAHVDAGKTTLSEQVLYRAKAVHHLGRVDHGDTFLDTHPIERQRGITVFSGQAVLPLGDDTVYWLDTPGHADFSTDMERAVSVMDYAVLMISCAEGVQSHTQTVWSLLKDYNIPTFLFLSKTDRADFSHALAEVRKRLTDQIVDLHSWQMGGQMNDTIQEQVAARDDMLLEKYFSGEYDESLWINALRQQIAHRRVFPVFSGSGLTGDGMDGFVRLLNLLTQTDYDAKAESPVSARVYRIRHTPSGQRLAFMKLLSGTLKVKDSLPIGQEEVKINEIHIYHGDKSRTVNAATAGDLVAIPLQSGLKPGDTIGHAAPLHFITQPMMAADLLWDEKIMPAFKLMEKLKPIQDEQPTLHLQQANGHISCRVMGKMQLQILRSILSERCGLPVSFGPCRVIYRETIAAPVIGIGHYEPLRHYAEVVLRLVPGERGSGITFRSLCHVDTLALNWQRLIETHVFQRTHKGVLIGGELTDIRIELLCGRSHLKHTEGGDFRQSVYRAIRNGLMHAQCVLLQPVCRYTMTVPNDLFGLITGEVSRLRADHAQTEMMGESFVFTGECPWSRFMPWQDGFAALTRGRGSLLVRMVGEAPCENQDEIVASAHYEPLADEPADSVFCSHGAGFSVAWQEVKAWAHCGGDWPLQDE